MVYLGVHLLRPGIATRSARSANCAIESASRGEECAFQTTSHQDVEACTR
jgi:hypothetical protein